MTTPALAGAGAMDQALMPRATVARAAIHTRECSEIFLTLSMLAFELKSVDTRVITVKIFRLIPRQLPIRSMTRPGACCSVAALGGERSPCRRLTASAPATSAG
jgi:hypothetical protein